MTLRFSTAAGLAVIAGLATLALSSPAQAYPQWQFTSGAVRCNQCHFSPAGGGLVTGYGRDAIGEELSTWEGDGAFLHGAADLPDWLKIGFDARGAMVMQNAGGPDQPSTALFPMQLDGQVRVEKGDFSFTGIVGFRGQVRDSDQYVPRDNADPANALRIISREHFVSWSPASRGPYVRAGRFFAPFGLRLAEHITYIRRDLGFNLLEETYNLSAGFLENAWEAHLTVFGPDLLQNGSQEKGVAGYYERRLFDEKASIAAQGRFALGEQRQTITLGAVAKYFLEPAKLLFMGEANLLHATPEGSQASNQFVGAGGLAFLPVRGIMLTGLAERRQTDITYKHSALNAATGLLSWFPYPHFEIQLVGRLQMPTVGDSHKTFLAQIHYFM